MKRLAVLALCLGFSDCADSVEHAARRSYDLTLPAPGDGSGWLVTRNAAERVATWRIRIDGCWEDYAQWIQPRLTKEFDSVTGSGTQRMVFVKTIAGDVYALELRAPDPPQREYVAAIFTARPF